MKQPKINESTCIACGSCASICSATFAVNGPHATVTNPTGNTEDEINNAISSCPTQSISWSE